MKICRCGQRIPQNKKKCDKCKEKDKERVRHYDMYERKNKEIYQSTEWGKLAEQCKIICNGLDIFLLFQENKIKKGRVAHHIVEVEEDPARIFDILNLIYLTDKSHAYIHKIYEQGKAQKQQMQQLLFEYMKKWREGYI